MFLFLYLFLQHQALSTQILLKRAPLLHLWTGLLVNQDVVNTLLPISEKESRGSSWILHLWQTMQVTELVTLFSDTITKV